MPKTKIHRESIPGRRAKKAGKPATTEPAAPPALIDLTKGITISVPWDSIERHPHNYRQHFDPADIAGIWESIRTIGLKDRLMVRPHPKPHGKIKYQLVDGERRHRGIELSPADHPLRKLCPIELHGLSDDQVAAIMLFTREQSRPLLTSERVAAFVDLAKGKTHEQVAAVVGEEVAEVASILRLARLTPEALALVDAGELHQSVAELVARISGDQTRGVALAHVLAGQHFVRAREKPPKRTAQSECLTYRETKLLIGNYFQVSLSAATFPRKALDLLPNTPRCEECPKRAGNDPEAVTDHIRADMCLDPACFYAKSKAHGEQSVEKAKAEGRPFLTAGDASKVFDAYGSHAVMYRSDYLDLHDTDDYDSKRRTYKTILGKKLEPEMIVAAVDQKGNARELICKADYKRLAGKKDAEKETKADENEKKERAKRMLESKIDREASRRYLRAAYEAGVKLFGEFNNINIRMILEGIAKENLSNCWGTTLEDMAGWRGLKGKTHEIQHVLHKQLDTATSPEIAGILCEMHAGRSAPSVWGGENSSKEIQEALGISFKQIEKQAKEDVTKPKEKKPGKRNKVDAHLERTGMLDGIEGIPDAVLTILGSVSVFTLHDLSEQMKKLKIEGENHKTKILSLMIFYGAEDADAETAAEAILTHLHPNQKPVGAKE